MPRQKMVIQGEIINETTWCTNKTEQVELFERKLKTLVKKGVAFGVTPDSKLERKLTEEIYVLLEDLKLMYAKASQEN